MSDMCSQLLRMAQRRSTHGARFMPCALQDVRVVLKEHCKGVSPGLTEGAPILIDDDLGDREQLADDRQRYAHQAYMAVRRPTAHSGFCCDHNVQLGGVMDRGVDRHVGCVRRGAVPDQDRAGNGAVGEAVTGQNASSGEVICLSDDDAQTATTRPTDPHSGDNYGQQRAVDISALLIRPILNQDSRAKRYLDALDRSMLTP